MVIWSQLLNFYPILGSPSLPPPDWSRLQLIRAPTSHSRAILPTFSWLCFKYQWTMLTFWTKIKWYKLFCLLAYFLKLVFLRWFFNWAIRVSFQSFLKLFGWWNLMTHDNLLKRELISKLFLQFNIILKLLFCPRYLALPFFNNSK